MAWKTYKLVKTVKLTPELAYLLERHAALAGVSMSEVIREALVEYLKARGYDVESMEVEMRRRPHKYEKPVVVV